MKRTLTLLAMSLVGMLVFAATWEKPVISESQYLPLTPGDTVYIYNVDSKLFLTEGNEWGTHATVGEEGRLFCFTKYVPEEEGAEWDGKTYLINDSSVTKGAWKLMFIDNENGDIYVDRGSQANYFWEFTPNGKTFRFFGADVNPEFNHLDELTANCFVGHATAYLNTQNNEQTGTGVIWDDPNGPDYNTEGSGKLYVDWTCISVADYDAYVGKIKAYNAAVKLAEVIERGKAAGVSTAAAEAVYNNTSSTPEQLLAAAEELEKAIRDAEAGTASPSNPVDMSGLIVNHDFANGDCTTGWSGTAFGRGGTVADGAEMYEKNFDAYQDLTGVYPGIYRVGVQAFYRAGGASEDYNNYIKNDLGSRYTTFYAINGEDTKVSVGVVHLASGAEESNLSGASEVECADGLYVSNTMAAADYHFNTLDKYHNYILCEVTESGTLRIGVQKDSLIGTDWSLFDNFSLEFYGNSMDSYKYWLEDILATLPSFDGAEYYTRSMEEEYTEVLGRAKSASDKETIKSVIPEVIAAADAFQLNINAYQAYVDYAEYCRNYLDEHSDLAGNEVDDLSDYFVLYYDDILTECSMTTEEITAEKEKLEQMLADAIKYGLSEGSDCTDMLVNASFANGYTGWNNNGHEIKVGGLTSFPVVETFQNIVDIYQDVTDVPNGLYSITANAFFRPAGNGNYDGSEEVPVDLYMGVFSTPIMHICADALPESLAEQKVNCYLDDNGTASGTWPYDYNVSGYGIVPNSVDGASYAFLAGRYVQTVYGLVTDGKMRIGLTSHNKKIEWALWANFKLTYMGKNAEAIMGVLPTLVEELSAYVDANAEQIVDGTETEYMTILMDAEDAIASEDEDALWQSLIDVNKAISSAKEAVALYEEYSEAVYNLYDTSEMYDNPSDDVIAAFDEVTSKFEDVDENYTVDELKALIDEINKVIGLFKLPADYKDASETNPIDFTSLIVNPNFDGMDYSGWSGSGFGSGGDVDECAERYNMAFDTYQDFAGLPKGLYEVLCKGFYRAGSAENDYNLVQADDDARKATVLYAKSDVENTEVPIVNPSSQPCDDVNAHNGGQSECASGLYIPNTMVSANSYFLDGYYDNSLRVNVGEGGKLRIGVKKDVTIGGDWAIFDTFQLIYYGDGGVSVETISVADVVAREYYSVGGIRLSAPQQGVNIVRARLADGSVRVYKELVP
ncbi:MAG: hypothetical protein IK000_03440 [Bacteroidaceae bacterium]|nr:hypothetical protein [Bacteroidaceae bacterium]